ncbi:MAG: hypothetical protein ACI8ZM_001071 [Crocinitomix sp.]|jgi:hypothetical protein
MIENYFDRITHNSRPHEEFSKSWGSYSSTEFVKAFLPHVNTHTKKYLKIYDGAELFRNGIKEDKLYFALDPMSKPVKLSIFTFANTEKTANNKRVLKPSEKEVFLSAAVNSNDSVTVNFKFGKEFKNQLNKFFKSTKSRKSVNALESQTLNMTKTEFKSNFGRAVEHLDVMNFILKGIDIDRSEVMSYYRTELHYSDDGDGFETYNFDAEKPEKGNNGAMTHGVIDRIALERTGYTGTEIESIYYGNWLRDFSSAIVGSTLGFDYDTYRKMENSPFFKKGYPNELFKGVKGKLTHKGWVKIIELMAANFFVYERSSKEKHGAHFPSYLKEFRKQYGVLDKRILGVYRPEEHIDNPKDLPDDSCLGIKSILGDGRIAVRYELPNKGYVIRTLSRGETGEFGDEHKIGGNMLKNYITQDTAFKNKAGQILELVSSSSNYFCQQIELALEKGRNHDGFLHFGAALHVLQDYYAHTNFVELSLIKIANDLYKIDKEVGLLALNTFPWVEIKDDVKIEKNGIKKAKQIPIVTGVFGTDDMKASMYPKIKRVLLPLEAGERLKINAGDRTLVNLVIITALEDYIEQEKGMPSSLKFRDPAFGWTYEEWLSTYQSLMGLDDGMVATGDAIAEGHDYVIDQTLPKDWADAVKKANKQMGDAIQDLGDGVKIYRNFILRGLFGGTEDEIKNKQTTDNPHFGNDPTHTQVAKDNVNHHFNRIAGLLAIEAVEDVAEKMAASWKSVDVKDNNESFNTIIAEAKTKYFVHPKDTDWMHEILTTWALKNKSNLRDGISAKVVPHEH